MTDSVTTHGASVNITFLTIVILTSRKVSVDWVGLKMSQGKDSEYAKFRQFPFFSFLTTISCTKFFQTNMSIYNLIKSYHKISSKALMLYTSYISITISRTSHIISVLNHYHGTKRLKPGHFQHTWDKTICLFIAYWSPVFWRLPMMSLSGKAWWYCNTEQRVKSRIMPQASLPFLSELETKLRRLY